MTITQLLTMMFKKFPENVYKVMLSEEDKLENGIYCITITPKEGPLTAENDRKTKVSPGAEKGNRDTFYLLLSTFL